MYARVKDNKVIEVINFNPVGKFHPSIIWQRVPGNVKAGWILASEGWIAPEVPEPAEPEAPKPPTLSVIEFKLCFTSEERVALYALVGTDAIITDWISILDDPRCKTVNLNKESVQQAVAYLVSLDILTPGRQVDVLLGLEA